MSALSRHPVVQGTKQWLLESSLFKTMAVDRECVGCLIIQDNDLVIELGSTNTRSLPLPNDRVRFGFMVRKLPRDVIVWTSTVFAENTLPALLDLPCDVISEMLRAELGFVSDIIPYTNYPLRGGYKHSARIKYDDADGPCLDVIANSIAVSFFQALLFDAMSEVDICRRLTNVVGSMPGVDTWVQNFVNCLFFKYEYYDKLSEG